MYFGEKVDMHTYLWYVLLWRLNLFAVENFANVDLFLIYWFCYFQRMFATTQSDSEAIIELLCGKVLGNHL